MTFTIAAREADGPLRICFWTPGRRADDVRHRGERGPPDGGRVDPAGPR